jgi:hypothetical protein
MQVMKMAASSLRYATLMEPAQFLIIKSEALTKCLGAVWRSMARWRGDDGGMDDEFLPSLVVCLLLL